MYINATAQMVIPSDWDRVYFKVAWITGALFPVVIL